MDLHAALTAAKFDKRLFEMNLRSGLITKAEYDQYLNSLKDLAHMSETVSLEDIQENGADYGAEYSIEQ